MTFSGGNLLEDLGVAYPIIQAPMSGGATTPELVATVCNAGGLGSHGVGYLTPDQIKAEIRAVRTFTEKPFNVNLFVGGYTPESKVNAEPMLSVLAEIHELLGLPAPTLPFWPLNSFDEQLEAVLEAQPAIFSFTFGVPSLDAMARLKSRGIITIGTATTAEEGRRLQERGVSAIVAQGAEAGGHRGTFLDSFQNSMIPTLELVRAIREVVSVPVIASGGLMNGHNIAESISSGAIAAQLGTAFLACPEAGTSEPYKRAVLSAQTDTTVITRAFSGRPARAIANAFVARLKGRDDIILPYPLQNTLTRPMRNAAAKLGEAGFLSLFAGQAVARARPMPAAKLVLKLVEEMKETQPISS